jgi:hypothetical protein
LRKEVKKLIEAWESLEGNKNYSPKDIERWLIKDMKPAIDSLRKKLKKK